MVKTDQNGRKIGPNTNIFAMLLSAWILPVILLGERIKTLKYFGIDTDKTFTESGLMQKRLLSPGDCFLLDGYNAAVLGEFFYTANRHDKFNLWPLHEVHKLSNNEFSSLMKNSRFHFYSTVGSEVGDPMFFELTQPAEKWENHTPYTEAALQLSPIPSLTLGIAFEQNDHFSVRQARFKRKTLNQEKAAWFGENMPSRSLVLGGFQYQTETHRIGGKMSGGWLWTPSPATGFYYPWQGGGVELDAVLWKRLEVQGGFQNWNSISTWHEDGTFTRVEIEGALSGEHMRFQTKINWKLHAGSRYLGLRLKKKSSSKQTGRSMAPFFTTHRRTPIPLGAKLTTHTPLLDSSLIIVSDLAFHLENTQINSNMALELRKLMSFGHVFHRLNAYYWNPDEFYLSIVEEYPDFNLGKTAFLTNNDFLGISTAAGGGISRPPFYVSAEAALVLEPNNLYFKADSIFNLNGLWLRSGSYHNFETPLLSTVEKFKAEVRFSRDWTMGATTRLRYFMGNNALKLDYLPSSVVCGLFLNKKFRTNLVFKGLTSFVSEKQVRHWREHNKIFRVPAHWEHSFTLVQTFWNDALKFHFTALHAFGDELAEHPNSSAMRFRIITGGEAQF